MRLQRALTLRVHCLLSGAVKMWSQIYYMYVGVCSTAMHVHFIQLI